MCAHSQITILRIRHCRLLYIVGTQHFERNLKNLEKTEIKKILKFYKNIYPNSKIIESKDTIETWMMMFGDFSYEQVQNAIVKFSKSNRYIPNLAENVEKYCSKGSLVGVEGRLRSRSYDNAQGQRVYVTEVVCDSVQFLETKSRDKYEEQQYHSQSTYNPNQYQQPTQNQQQDSFMNENPPFNIMEDDIQF